VALQGKSWRGNLCCRTVFGRYLPHSKQVFAQQHQAGFFQPAPQRGRQNAPWGRCLLAGAAGLCRVFRLK